MPGKSFRNNFTSGVLDPKLASRSDLPQYRTGMSTGTNVFLLPHGGVRRRPGIWFISSGTEKGRLGKFRFSKNTQYLLEFTNNLLTIRSADLTANEVTQIETPYTTADIEDIYLKAQIADTLVIFHPDYAPHKMLRSAAVVNGIKTIYNGFNLKVYVPEHDLLTGDKIGISGATNVGAYTAATYINEPFAVTVRSGTIVTAVGTNSEVCDLTWKKANTVEINLDNSGGSNNRGFEIGDTITLEGFEGLGGIPADQINRKQTITDIRGRITFNAGASATSAAVGGGSTATISKQDTGVTVRTVSGSPLVYVGPISWQFMPVGRSIAVSGVSAPVGGIPAGTINGTRAIVAAYVDGVYTVNVGTNATSSAINTTATVDVSYTLNPDPIYTTASSTSVKLDVPSWLAKSIAASETFTLANLTTTGGIAIGSLNGSRTATATTDGGSRLQFATQTAGSAGGQTKLGSWKADSWFEVDTSVLDDTAKGTINNNGVTTTTQSSVITVDIGLNSVSYGSFSKFNVGDYVVFENLSAVGGISTSILNHISGHKITAVSDTGSRITVDVGTRALSSTTGGGSTGIWKTGNNSGGGSNIRVWSIMSMDPAAGRKGKLRNIPQYDYQDGLSPQPKAERQEIIFDTFAAGDRYSLVINMPGYSAGAGKGNYGDLSGPTVSVRASNLTWSSVYADNAKTMVAAINLASVEKNVVSIEWDSVGDGLGANQKRYYVQFAYARPIELVQVEVVRSTNGIVTVNRLVEGGSTQEDIISSTRGWPSGGIFYQRRLWMFGLKSRPATLLASQTEDFFNFDIGDGLDSECINVTGDFDPIRHLVADRGLFLLTDGSEIQITGGGDGAAITPGNINLQVASRYGATTVTPVSVAGRPVYIDSVGRNVRQFGSAGDGSGESESKEISILSQHLINSPTRMDMWRNSDGDYLFVVNSDGTAAVLNINMEQGVVGWTKATSVGSFVDVCQAGDKLYVKISWTGTLGTRYYLGVFDYGLYTDLAQSLAWQSVVIGSLTIPFVTVGAGFQGAQFQGRADGKSLDRGNVGTLDGTQGRYILAINSASYSPTSAQIEAGFPMPTPTVVPMAPQIDQYSAISKANVDLYESKQVYVNGFKLRDSNISPTIASETPITGFRPIQLRGYGDRVSITITAPNPQPMTLRAIEMEIV